MFDIIFSQAICFSTRLRLYNYVCVEGRGMEKKKEERKYP
jgi:hypothetical protein